MEDSDFAFAMGNDSAFSLGKLPDFRDKYFWHVIRFRPVDPYKSMAPNCTARQRSGFAISRTRVAVIRIVLVCRFAQGLSPKERMPDGLCRNPRRYRRRLSAGGFRQGRYRPRIADSVNWPPRADPDASPRSRH